jgi:predicted RNA-binding Zn-ribbon protein involved in translation (DUF1610 family)
MTISSEDQSNIPCPACQANVALRSDSIALHCENCGHEFFIDSSTEDEASAAQAPAHEPSELDAVRIRQRITLVRSAYRSRSYAIIAAVVCGVLAIQSVISTARRFSAKSYPPAMVYLLCAIAGTWGLVYFSRKAAGLDLEAKRSALNNPTAEPDFSALGDGSERVRNLEDIR